MPPVPVNHPGAGPSNLDKFKMGAMMGGTVGAIMGFMYGSYAIMRYGAGANGIGRTIGQYMLTSGSTFGFFMAIGSVIRHDAPDSLARAYQRHPRRAVFVAPYPREQMRTIEIPLWRRAE